MVGGWGGRWLLEGEVWVWGCGVVGFRELGGAYRIRFFFILSGLGVISRV